MCSQVFILAQGRFVMFCITRLQVRMRLPVRGRLGAGGVMQGGDGSQSGRGGDRGQGDRARDERAWDDRARDDRARDERARDERARGGPGAPTGPGDPHPSPGNLHVDWLAVTEISDDDYRSFCLPCHELDEPESGEGAGAERAG